MSVLCLYCFVTSDRLFCRVFEGLAPPHFYGEMVKTEQGCRLLAEKGHFTDFTHFIRQHGYDSEDSDIILKLKSVLWAVVSNSHVLLVYLLIP